MVGKAAAFDALASILEYNAGSDRVFMILGVKVGSVHSTGSVRGPTRSLMTRSPRVWTLSQA